MAGQIADQRVVGRAERDLRVLYRELSPAALTRLFGIEGETLTGRACQMHELGPAAERCLESSFLLGVTGTMDEHIAEAVRYFGLLIERASAAVPHVEYAVDRLEAENGLVRVADSFEPLPGPG